MRTTVEIHLVGTGTGPAVEHRVRQLLRTAVRAYGLRCTRVRTITQTTLVRSGEVTTPPLSAGVGFGEHTPARPEGPDDDQ